MLIRTPVDLGAVIRESRKKLGLDQMALAKKAGTSRQWIVAIEGGKPRAAIGLVLRTLQALGVTIDLHQGVSTQRSTAIDVNHIISKLRKKTP